MSKKNKKHQSNQANEALVVEAAPEYDIQEEVILDDSSGIVVENVEETAELCTIMDTEDSCTMSSGEDVVLEEAVLDTTSEESEITPEGVAYSDAVDIVEEMVESIDESAAEDDITPVVLDSIDDILQDNTSEQEAVTDEGLSREDEQEAVGDEDLDAIESVPAEKEMSEAEKERLAQKALAKEERKKKTKEWFKGHKGLVAILCVVVLLVAGLTAGHFVHNAKLVVVHDASDLEDALASSKKELLIFKEDVTYTGDLTLNGYSLDLRGHTLVVEGDLKLNGKDAPRFVASRSYYWGANSKDGCIIANNLSVSAGDWEFLSTVKASILSVSCNATLTDAMADILVNAGKVAVKGTVSGTLNADETSFVEVSGSIDKVVGGIVTAQNGSQVKHIDAPTKLTILPHAVVQLYSNVSEDKVLHVRELEPPVITLQKLGNTHKVLIASVMGATKYVITFGDNEAVTIAKSDIAEVTEYILPEMLPGNHILSVVAKSDNDNILLPSMAATRSVAYAVQLATPEFTVTELDTSIEIKVNAVKYATEYQITANGKAHTLPATIDGKPATLVLTEEVSAVGTYPIEVVALSSNGNYLASEPALSVYRRTVVLDKPVIDTVSMEDMLAGASIEVSMKAIPNAHYICITVLNKAGTVVGTYALRPSDNHTLDTQSFSIELYVSRESVSEIRVQAIGYGYYKDSDITIYNVDDVETPTPVED